MSTSFKSSSGSDGIVEADILIVGGNNVGKQVKSAAKKPISVATRCSANHTGTTLAGTTVGVTYRYAHVMKTECSDLQFVFANFYPTTTTESSNANSITIAVSLEYNGSAQRLHFNGSATKTLSQGGIGITDPFWRDIPVGATFFTRTWVSVPVDTNTYPQGIAQDFSMGDSKGTGDVAIASGILTDSGGEAGFGPAAIIGVPKEEGAVAFALLGDSIVTSPSGIGWPINLVGINYGYSILSRPSSTVVTMQSNSPNAYRMRLMRYFTHAIVNFGTNDFNGAITLAAQEALMGDLWRSLKTSGLEVYQSTVMPRSTSTDGWVTTANQTTVTTNSYNSKRVQFNDKLRAGSYPVKILDVANAIDSSLNSGIWKAAYTIDGIHPTAIARDAVVASVSLGLD